MATSNNSPRTPTSVRRYFLGGSDARIIMGEDEAALIRLWREKRGEVGPEDLSRNLPVQLGLVTEELNRLLVRDQHRRGHYRRPEARPPSDRSLARRHARRTCPVEWRGVRVEVHAALVFFGRSGRSEIHAAAAA